MLSIWPFILAIVWKTFKCLIEFWEIGKRKKMFGSVTDSRQSLPIYNTIWVNGCSERVMALSVFRQRILQESSFTFWAFDSSSNCIKLTCHFKFAEKGSPTWKCQVNCPRTNSWGSVSLLSVYTVPLSYGSAAPWVALEKSNYFLCVMWKVKLI